MRSERHHTSEWPRNKRPRPTALFLVGLTTVLIVLSSSTAALQPAATTTTTTSAHSTGKGLLLLPPPTSPLQNPWKTRTMRKSSSVLLWSSMTSKQTTAGGGGRRRKERPKTNTNGSQEEGHSRQQRRKGRQDSLEKVVAKMGLTPVPKTRKKGAAKVNDATATGSLPKSSKNNNTTNQRYYVPSLQSQLDYARNGHAVLRHCVDPSTLERIRHELLEFGTAHELVAWRQKVEVAITGGDAANQCRTVQDCRDALDRCGIPSHRLPFLQYFNLWRTHSSVYELASELAETASVLMDCSSVKLYQDSFFWKRSRDGPTPWHTDARMAPFDTPSLITLWIPLHDIPTRYGSALQFVSKSHADFALPFWNPYHQDDDNDDNNNNNHHQKTKTNNPWNHLEVRYQHNKIVNYMPLAMGDLTAHSGWTLHCADSQQTSLAFDDDGDNDNVSTTTKDRLALALSYVDARAPVRKGVLTKGDHGDDEDQWSYAEWVKEVPAGQEFEHPLVPIVWPPPPN